MGVEMTGKDEIPPGGGVRSEKHPGVIPGEGGMMGQTPWRHPARARGGGWDKQPGATQLPQPGKECESCMGKGGGG